VKIIQSEFIINAEARETKNATDSDAYDIGNPNECEETYQETISQEETDDFIIFIIYHIDFFSLFLTEDIWSDSVGNQLLH
jgi:hypothetical protein